MIFKIPAAILLTSALCLSDEFLQQPKDFYVEMAALNLFTYRNFYNMNSDPAGKLSLGRDMAFIAFNYFVQKERGIIRWSPTYEKAIRVSYTSIKATFDKENPYMNPCGWKEGADKPKLQFPKTHRLTLAEYQNMTKRFVEFLNQEAKTDNK